MARSVRVSIGLAGLCLVPFLAACGDDDEKPPAATGEAPPTETTAPATVTETAPAEEITVPEEELEQLPEEQPGGAGDEVPAQSPALFAGRDGRVTPRVVRVPPFIAIGVALRSADGGEYGLRCDGRSVRVGGGGASAPSLIAGRRPGEKVRCTPLGGHNGVTIVASAEPGP